MFKSDIRNEPLNTYLGQDIYPKCYLYIQNLKVKVIKILRVIRNRWSTQKGFQMMDIS